MADKFMGFVLAALLVVVALMLLGMLALGIASVVMYGVPH